MDTESTSDATYEELAQLELEFEEIDTEILAKHYALNTPIFAKRAATVSKIPDFWPLVFEQAPPEIDHYIQPSDSAVLAAALRSVSVSRPEVPSSYNPRLPPGKSNPFGEPRTVCIRFEFAPNEWFEDSVLEKTFWFRHARDGWVGHASEPVRIRWKPGKDLTGGLTDAAAALWEAQQKAVVGKGLDVGSREGREASQGLKEFERLKTLVDNSTEGSLSFFNWFGSRGRWVTEKESREAEAKEREKRAAAKRGEEVEDSDDEEDEEVDETDMAEMDTEIFPAAEETAIAIAEDLWPSAIRYFMEAQELNLSDSEDDFVEDEDEEMKDADVDEDEESSSEEEQQKMQDVRAAAKSKAQAVAGAASSAATKNGSKKASSSSAKKGKK